MSLLAPYLSMALAVLFAYWAIKSIRKGDDFLAAWVTVIAAMWALAAMEGLR